MSAADAGGLTPARIGRIATERLAGRARREAGGSARLRVIVLFAAVDALVAADQGTVGALAPKLEHALHITNGQIGIIASVAALAGAVGTIPAGMLVDRVHRVHLLAASILIWSVAMVASALAPSFLLLVVTRVALGAVTATAGPALASLTGDFFLPRERANIWGLILSGELIGSGIGLVGSGNIGGALSWRYGFGWLAIPGVVLGLAVWKLLVEPARGGQSRLEPGAEEQIDAETGRQRQEPGEADSAAPIEGEQDVAQDLAREQDQTPHEELVLHRNPVDMPIWQAVRYVLRVRTNLVLILASSLGYLFFAGVQTFAVLLLRTRYGLSQPAASSLLILIGLGALAGVLGGGRIADRLLDRGRISARVMVAGVCYIAAAVLFLPGLASSVLVVSMPLFILAAAALAAPNPPLNAARLDIMHPRLWGRAEGVRTVLQMLAYAIAPLIFGYLSDALGGPGASSAISSSGKVAHSSALAYTFLIMLVPLAIGGISLLWARRTYPRDVATAAASIAATGEPETDSGPGPQE